MPVTVALARYIEAHGFGGSYPFWYLGTTPVKYLTGPIAPAILIGLHKIFPSLTFFDLSYVLLVTCYLLQALGWGLLAANLSGSKKVGWWVGGFMLIAPFHIFWNLAFGEVSGVMATALTPFVMWFFVSSFGSVKKRSAKPDSEFDEILSPRSSLRQHQISDDARTITGGWLRHVFDQNQNYLIPSAAFGLLLLTNTTASIPAMMALAVLGIIIHKRWEDGLKSAALVVISGFVLTIWWYTPAYWLTIVTSSSIGGRNAFGAFIWILNMLRSLVPIILALAVVLWGFKPKGKYWRFAIAWTAVFGLLTLLRFAANPAFWLDWTAWMGEVEVGLMLLVSYNIARGPVSRFLPVSARSDLKTDVRGQNNADLRAVGIPSTTTTPRLGYVLFVVFYFLFGYFLIFQNRHLWMPRWSIENSVEYRISSELNSMVKPGETVLLSGSTAFWLNSLYDIRQVRGGRDEASVDKNWQEDIWKIRQGDLDQTEEALEQLKVDYLVVHGENSSEFYHDFSNVDKFENLPDRLKIFEDKGDIIYKVK